MFVKFGLDTDTLLTGFSDAVARRGIHMRFLELWRDFGVLVDGNSNLASSDLATAINSLPQDIRKPWQDALRFHRFSNTGGNWRALNKAQNRKHLLDYKGKIDLAIFEDTRAAALGLPVNDGAALDSASALEICRLDFVDQSKSFQEARAISSSTIRKGEKPPDIWKTRFAGLAEHSRSHIAIIDRYASERHSLSPAMSGLRKLLTELDNGKPGCRVSLFSAFDKLPEKSIISGINSLVSGLNRGGLSEVKLYTASTKSFGKIAHYRYVRFDRTIYQLDSGLEVLEGNSVYRSCLVTMRPYDSDFRDHENDLRHTSTETKIK